MKYAYWLLINVVSIVGKLLGNPLLPIVWIAFSVREWSRGVIYSYSLANGINIKRLEERSPTKIDGGWELHGYHTKGGFVKDRDVSWLEYKLALMFWVWIDDDSSCDTFNDGHNRTYINGERKLPKWCIDRMLKANMECTVGSQFDIGDKRAENPNLELVSTFVWVGRNSFYNFNYKYMQTNDASKIWYKKIGRLEFGWVPDSPVNGVKYWKSIFGINF